MDAKKPDSGPEKPVKPTLDDFLSLEPMRSEPIEIERAGKKVKVIFQEVPNDLRNLHLMEGIQAVEDRRRELEKQGSGEWRDAETDLDVLKREEQELRTLCAAMKNPSDNSPAFSLSNLRYYMGSPLMDFLGNKYAEFEAGINPDSASDELVEALIDDVKKNEDLALLWTRYGSHTALRCVQYLVAQVEKYQTESSSGTDTGDMPLSEKPSGSD